MATSIIEKKRYTYDDYLKTPDDKRYELIEGDLSMTPSPITNHQRISRKIEFLLEKYVTENIGDYLALQIEWHYQTFPIFV